MSAVSQTESAVPTERRASGMTFTLEIWRQRNSDDAGRMVEYKATRVSPDMSFLEMLDVLNEDLMRKGEEPFAFDSDCREGICGMCGLVIDGVPHGPGTGTTTCQLYMRLFKDGSRIRIEPWRARSFPVVRDLVVDRSAFDRIIQAGGYTSVNTGSAPDGNAILISQATAEEAMDSAACVGCGACVAACPNATASLFLSAKIAHLNLLPQGQPERYKRTREMVQAHDEAGFGGCTNHKECEAACPKGISTDWIAKMNRDLLVATITGKDGKFA